MLDKIPGQEKLRDTDVILVTGGSGLLGRAIQHVSTEKKLKGKWIFLSSKDGDLRDYEQAKKLFKQYKPTYVIHLAAFVGGLFKNMKYKVQFWFDNVNINNNVLRLCHEYGVTKVVSCLSTCIFPDKTTYPIDETMLHNGPPHFSNDAYAYSKRMLERLGHWYMEQNSKTKFTTVIPTNLFGPHDNYHLEDAHVLPALMHKCLIAEKNGTDFVVLGSGKPLRQFLFSWDAAELMIWVMLQYDDAESIIISVGEEDEISIGQAAQYIYNSFDMKGKMVFDTSKADGQFKKTASNKKLLKLFPDYKFTPMEEAIKISVQWFKENYETCRK